MSETGEGPRPEEISGRGETQADREISTERRKSINNLAVNVLLLRNPSKSAEDINALFLSRNDILTTTPLSDVLRVSRPEKDTLQDYDDAVKIARYYWDNPDTRVPTKVLGVNEPVTDPIVSQEPDEKVLIFLDSVTGDKNKDQVFQFGEIGRKLLGSNVKQTRPDVYIEALPHYKKPSRNKSVERPDSITVAGADNLLLQGYHNFEDTELRLSCEGDMALLSNSRISGNKAFIRAPHGDIKQYPGTALSIKKIECQNFIQLGGAIRQPKDGRGEVICHEEFIQHPGGGIEPEPYVTLKDKHYLDRVGTSDAARKVMENTLGLSPQDITTDDTSSEGTSTDDVPPNPVEKAEADVSDKELVPHTRKEWSELFDHEYSPQVEFPIADDGSINRGYTFEVGTIEQAKSYTDFLGLAISAGWEVSFTDQAGNTKSVILKKKPQE